jgi:hypothetical protein
VRLVKSLDLTEALGVGWSAWDYKQLKSTGSGPSPAEAAHTRCDISGRSRGYLLLLCF